MAYFVENKPARQPFLRAPASVIGLIGVLVAAHVARVLAPSAVSERILNDYALVPARYAAGMPTAHGGGSPLSEQVIGLFSHMLLHANTMHIAVNCVWLLAFGPLVARRFGGVAFFVFFALCGVAGALFYITLNWCDAVGVIGASGAISGLMGAAIRMMRLRQPNLNAPTLPLMPILSSQVLGFSAVWLAVNLLTGMFGFATTGQIEPVAWQDHMGGYLAGLVLVGLFDRLIRPAERHLRQGA
jgi:membrane associated rhomboid family serine protease